MADTESTYELWQDGVCVAKTFGPDEVAQRDIRHYVMVYGQDGPVTIYKREGRKRIEVMP